MTRDEGRILEVLRGSAASSSLLSGRLIPLSAASFSPSSRATVICVNLFVLDVADPPPTRPSSDHTRSPGRLREHLGQGAGD
jgi:hypothetical protein